MYVIVTMSLYVWSQVCIICAVHLINASIMHNDNKYEIETEIMLNIERSHFIKFDKPFMQV